MKKIGILGGTFNPIHNAHLVLAECSYEQFGLDFVWLMPSKTPPHKLNQKIEGKEHRAKMIKSAITDIPYFEFSDFELSRRGITYTADTLSMLTEEYKDVKFYFILGEDSLFKVEQWRQPEVLFDLAYVIVARRGINEIPVIEERIDYLKDKYNTDSIGLLDSPTFDISSSYIRGQIRSGKSVRYYIPQEVEQYIRDEKLYIENNN